MAMWSWAPMASCPTTLSRTRSVLSASRLPVTVSQVVLFRYSVGCAHHHEHSSHRQITVEYLCIVVWSMVGSGLLPSPDAERSIKGRLAKPREGMVRYIPA